MIQIRSVSRLKAASIHLAISAAIAAVALAVMLALWYPPPLFEAMGGAELIVLIVGVDVAIGPLITLIIFDTRKKELVFDLAVVAVLQIAALAYGSYAMHAGRPVFIVFTGDQLAVVAAAEIDPDELAKGSRDEFRRLSLTGPRLVATKPPTDPNELSTITFAALSGVGLQHLPRHYAIYADHRAEVLKASRPLADLDLSAGDQAQLANYLAQSPHKAETLRCLPVATKRALLTALIDASGDVIDMLAFRPTIGGR